MSYNRTDHMIGKQYGRLTVLTVLTKSPHAYVQCRCTCGRIVSVYAYNVRRGVTRSCGCLFREVVKLPRPTNWDMA